MKSTKKKPMFESWIEHGQAHSVSEDAVKQLFTDPNIAVTVPSDRDTPSIC
jgi:hypothetical protein